MENNTMDKVESVMSLLNKLYRTVIYDGTQFNVLNPDEEYSDWEYTEDCKVKRVYSTTGQQQTITEFFYNNNGDLDKMVSSTNGKETSVRTFSYDNKGRCIKEDSPYEIIVRSYNDENGTCRVETKDISDEEIIIEEFAKFNKISVENNVYKRIIMENDGVSYRKISEVVYKVTEDIPLVKRLFEYDDENSTFTIKQFGRNSGTNSDILQMISEDKYRTDYDVELETSKFVINKEGLFEEHRFVYTWNDKFDAITHSDYFINDKLENSLDHKFRTEGNAEIIEITGGTTISKYKDDQGISHEDAAVMFNNELSYNTFKTTKDGISVYNYAPAYQHSSPYIEIQSDNNKIEMLSENGKFQIIKFSLNGKDYEYRVAKNNINCYARVEIYDGDSIKHSDEIFFKSNPDETTDEIIKYIIEKFKEYISTNETLKLLLSKGGFDYEKIGGGITD